MAKNKKVMKTFYLDQEIVPIFDLLSNRNDFITSAVKYFANSDSADWIFKDADKVRELLGNLNNNVSAKQTMEKTTQKEYKEETKINSIQSSEGFDSVD